MGTKNIPGEYDAYVKAHPDEPMFVLLARDPHAPGLVRLWAELREIHTGNPSQVMSAQAVALEMEKWKARRSTNADDDGEGQT